MLTPQEVSTHSFAKASFGGYNMAMVDEFLDELTDDYTALYKENAALKAKLKVLVEKVEEYRATEDSMRATLLTAQRMADSIVKEAEQKRDQMMTQAEIDAKLRINKEIQLLNELPQAPVELPQEEAKPEDSVQEIEDSVMAAFSEAAPEEDGDAAETQTEASEPVAEAADPAADTSDPFGDFPDLSSTRQINLDELKFGRNYNT